MDETNFMACLYLASTKYKVSQYLESLESYNTAMSRSTTPEEEEDATYGKCMCMLKL